ncbi:complement factor H-like isoform X2 [Girardinichthys multiradiatus]|uniref:complement factor H-like isoform X2 n=1 Tax=Girardinichthys multiradiatus TaxID=208333 RepID=UPI001FAE4422|nr:complement factor H-like isoform X2 [Girardinichthys multiradiatus]
MHVIAKSCVLLLWVQLLASVKCQDCTLQQFKNSGRFDSTFDVSGLDNTYSGGKQVRVPCNVGYGGFFKMICTEQGWEFIGTNCQPKSCGHPGDAQFADFRLEIGEDFVFGSQVVYECYRGYHMVSRTSRRRCVADGWDGNIPVCEATKCPVFHVDNNVQVLGDPEEASSGNVIRFSCKSNDEILNGLKEIYCKDDGEWSAPVPICKAIRCSVPQIEHGSVLSGSREYKENEILNFRCDPTYKKATERLPKCTKFAGNADWSPTPACELIKCHLTLPPLTGTTYDPPNKNMFSPGETLRVSCGEQHWILDTRTRLTEVTCLDNGDWNTDPVCQEVICPGYIYEEHYTVNTWGRKKLGDRATYHCDHNYQATHADRKATCSRDGWGPKPLCRGTSCEKPNIENIRITRNDKRYYSHNEKLTYECLGGTPNTVTITCVEGTWQGIEQCSAFCERLSDSRLTVTDTDKETYMEGDVIAYVCTAPGANAEGNATCKNGKWIKTEKCPGIPCKVPQLGLGLRFFGIQPKNNEVNPEVKVVFSCEDEYDLEGSDEILCLETGNWNAPLPTCSEKCSLPDPLPDNVFITSSIQGNAIRKGDQISFGCKSSFLLKGSETMTCVENGEWSDPLPKCEEKCSLPDPLPDNVLITSSIQGNAVRKGDQISFACKSSLPMKGSETITCVENEKWSNPLPKCEGASGCSAPPGLTDGDTTSITRSDSRYRHGDKVEYICQPNYKMDGGPFKTCDNGIWTGEMRCLKPCTVTKQLMNTNNIQFRYSGESKLYTPHLDRLTFSCKKRTSHVGSVPLRVQCNDGVITLPTCQ